MEKRILSVLLSLCLSVGSLFSVVLADTPVYVALGDSIAAGYGLQGFENVRETPEGLICTTPPGCFPALVSDALGYQLQNLAVSGDDTVQLLERLQTDQYTAAVKSADLISLTIGSNDLLGPTIELLRNHLSVSDFLSGGDIQSLLQQLQQINDLLSSADTTALFDSQIQAFCKNWDTIISTITGLNPDATLLVTSYYNPYASFNLQFGTANISIGQLGDSYLDRMNRYITTDAACRSSYTVIDISDVSTNVHVDTAALMSGMMRAQAIDLSGSVSLDPHPDASGHELIAQRISAVLSPSAFSDVSSEAWYAEAVYHAADQGFVVGDPSGLFHPEAEMSVVQYITVLYRYVRLSAADMLPELSTSGDNWTQAAEYINTQLLGGAFANLSAPMTRYEMAKITASVLKAAASVTGRTPNTRTPAGFADTQDEDVLYLQSIYGVDGEKHGDGLFYYHGDDTITRAEVAQVVYNITTRSFG